MPAGELAVALAASGPDGVDDDGGRHVTRSLFDPASDREACRGRAVDATSPRPPLDPVVK
jgi:hypothetical protein